MKTFIFVFSLFAIFLTANADPFQLNSCTPDVMPLIVGITVAPPVASKPEVLILSGSLDNGNKITANKTIIQIGFFNLSGSPISNYYNQTFNGTYNGATEFDVNVRNVPIPAVSDSYTIGVFVGDPENPTPFICTYATFNEAKMIIRSVTENI
ncbi:26050_t:CDS:2 [Dentiscutata erythropus]|uniref:26050_t:CDS:1 n=1 Tax=Dentiscutata erythropus TaxID=1348616 RepID=A0A9N9C6W4_9GLOM|nr:26050_t:CDS:2 [Dentiscutata erythropus]